LRLFWVLHLATRSYDLGVKYCTGCGQPRMDGAAFCTTCGQRTEPAAATVTAAAPQIPASAAGSTPYSPQDNSLARKPRKTLVIGAAMAVAAGLVTVFAVSTLTGKETPATGVASTTDGTNSTDVDPGTVPSATIQQLACNPTPPGGVPVDQSSPTAYVSALQWGLANLDYGITGEPGAPALPITGVFDDVTAQAIGRFQTAGRSLPQTQIGDAATWAEMSASLRTFRDTNRC